MGAEDAQVPCLDLGVLGEVANVALVLDRDYYRVGRMTEAPESSAA